MQLSKLKNERGEAWTPSPGSPGGDIILYMLKYLHFRSFMSTGLPIHFFLLFLMKLSFVSKLRIWSQKSNSLGSNSCSFAYWLFDLGQIIYSPHTLVCSADSWSLWALNEWKLVNHLGLVLCRHSLTGLLPTHSARRVNEKKIPLPPRFLPFFTVLVWWHCSGDRMAPTLCSWSCSCCYNVPSLGSSTTSKSCGWISPGHLVGHSESSHFYLP